MSDPAAPHDPLQLQRTPSSAWRATAAVRISSLRGSLDGVGGAEARARIERLLDSAWAAVCRPTDIARAWTGVDIERAWQSVHAAEVARFRALEPCVAASEASDVLRRCTRAGLGTAAEARLASLVTKAEAHFPVDGGTPGDAGKDLPKGWQDGVATALDAALSKSDNEHARARSFRNVLFTATFVATAIALLVIRVSYSHPQLVPLCVLAPSASASASASPTPTGSTPAVPTAGSAPTASAKAGGSSAAPSSTSAASTSTATSTSSASPTASAAPSPRVTDALCPAGGDVSSAADVWAVALFGVLGAAITGAVSIRRLDGTSTPYAVPMATVLLKLPLGAITAVVGLLALRAGFVPDLTLTGQTKLLVYAVLLGASQQLFTDWVDKQAQRVLGVIPSGTSADDKAPAKA